MSWVGSVGFVVLTTLSREGDLRMGEQIKMHIDRDLLPSGLRTTPTKPSSFTPIF